MDGSVELTEAEKDVLATADSLRSGQTVEASGLVGANDHHRPIYQIDYTILIESYSNIAKLCSNNPNDILSMANPDNTARRANHQDRDGNLPDPPYIDGNEHGYLEFHVEKSGVKNPKNLRIVYDTGRRRLYVSPSHYNVWKDRDGTEMNPFILVAGCPPLVSGRDAKWE